MAQVESPFCSWIGNCKPFTARKQTFETIQRKEKAGIKPAFFFYAYCVSFNGRGLFTLTPTLSNGRKGSATLTLALSPQGRGNL
jgi:hypothetical protein